MSSCHRNFSLQTKIIRHVRRNTGMYRFATCAAVVAAAPRFLNIPWYAALAASAALYLLTGGWKWVRLAWKTLGRDLKTGKILLQVELDIKRYVRNKMLLGDIFEERTKEHPDKPCIISAETGYTLTYQQADELANKIGNIFYEAGYREGDTVALLMENRVEYLPVWLGLSKIGVITSLLNFNLRGESLKHCINVCECKAIIYSGELEDVLKDVASDMKIEYYSFDKENTVIENAKYVQRLLSSASRLKPPKPMNLTLLDKVLYIYTSGTTGNPKAAVIRGTRFAFMSFGVGRCIGATSSDISYNTLPLYHSNGGIALAGAVVFIGNTLVTRKKFSASKFFEDCTKYNITIINYIGETCRYLVAQPKGKFDKSHKIRVATGNGLRASIWEEFQERFNIPKVCEFYGATEGNANMLNVVGKVGAVGFNSVLFPGILPIKLVRVDEEGNVMRDSNGLVIDAKPGEVGELVGKIKTDAMRQFDGYVNKSATQKKIISDVYCKGDKAFLTGDRLMQDEEGFYYFQDRTGDTFRWKGENVSTNEVEGVISKSLQLNDVCVYGVEVPGIEGKAGTACIADPERQVNLSQLLDSLNASLPPYARPVFIRIVSEIAKTSTYKFKKNQLRDEGFDPSRVEKADQLYYFDGKEKKFIRIDSIVYEKIKNQEIRF